MDFPHRPEREHLILKTFYVLNIDTLYVFKQIGMQNNVLMYSTKLHICDVKYASL